MGRGQLEYSVQHSTEGSTDSSTEGLHRPRRSCRQHTSTFIEEQLLEDLEERRLLTDRRTLRLKEKNKRAQQRFRERQKEKSQQAADQVQLLQKQVVELRSRAAAAQNRSQLLEKLLALRDGEGTLPEAKPSLQIFAPFDGFAALPETAFVMQLRGYSSTGPVLIAKEQVQAMDLDQHRGTWKAYIEKIAEALREADGNLQSMAARHLQGLVDELCAWCVWVNQLSPHILAKMKSIPLDGSLTQAHPPHLLLNVLKRYGLSEEQTRQMVAARRFCLATLVNLMRERLIMQETLQEVISGGSSWNNMNDSHLKMVEMQQRLAHNVEAESHAFHTFMTSALRRVLNPIQTAALLVAAFPFMPNIMSVVACLSGEEADKCSDDDLLVLDPVPLVVNPVPLPPADSLGTSLDALWSDIFLT